MGHCALWNEAVKSVTISTPWAIAQVSVMRYEPQCRIFGYVLWAIAQEFCYALLAIVQDLVRHYGP
jgi:hypothetical protein